MRFWEINAYALLLLGTADKFHWLSDFLRTKYSNYLLLYVDSIHSAHGEA